MALVLAVGWSQVLTKISTDRDLVIVRRYHACLKSRRAGVSWENTLDRIVLEFPLAVIGDDAEDAPKRSRRARGRAGKA